MKTYQIITTEFGKKIKATEGEKILWIPLEPANSDYAEYLAYTAWVETGNNPDEFWEQTKGAI